MNFSEIFEEYYTIFRGQNSNIPVSGDREYDTAIQLGNNAIRKWDRADGVEWKELRTTLIKDAARIALLTPPHTEVAGDLLTVASQTAYAAPLNMRKPPGFITVGSRELIKVISPAQADQYGGVSSAFAYFTGSANTGFTLHFDNGTDAGLPIDYTYLRKPVYITDGTSVPDMSDPNFMIQEMLATRFLNNRNGFGYKITKQEATLALQNMKIENNSGTEGNSDNLGGTGGWGMRSRNARII